METNQQRLPLESQPERPWRIDEKTRETTRRGLAEARRMLAAASARAETREAQGSVRAGCGTRSGEDARNSAGSSGGAPTAHPHAA